MARPQRFCIFCGGSRLSREHIWPDWLRNYVPRDMTSHTQGHAVIGKLGTTTKAKTLSGDPRSRRLRVVCESCNNGWMSQLQERIKPILVPLLKGESVRLRRSAQIALATWSTMFAMVAEYVFPDSVVSPPRELRLFKDNQHPLDNWQFWIGRYVRGRWVPHAVRNLLAFIPAKQFTQREREGLIPFNTQELTFTVGQLYIRAFSSSLPRIKKPWVIPKECGDAMVRIWPLDADKVRWPPSRTLDDREAEIVANWTLNLSRHITGL